MCGISGIWTPHRDPTDVAAVERMVMQQQHRGPDDRQIVTVPLPQGQAAAVLGFNRLSILDLSAAGRQPISDPATGSWLVCNGEIYNFRALRAELAAQGHVFRSSGDAEVLLHALVAWEERALERLEGMYAFAFVDGRSGRLLLGRDPFGIKPLLLARSGARVAFASELRTLRAGPLRSVTLDARAIESYLAFGAVPEPCTAVQEAVALPPGHVVVIEPNGQVRAPRRWVTPRSTPAAGPADPTEQTHAILAEATARHLVSDVPVGVFLSSGIDSSLLAMLAARTPHAPDLTYLTVGFGNVAASEVPAAQRLAATLPGRHEILDLHPEDVLAALPSALAAMDQPTVDGINTFLISRAAAARGLKVVLSGLGGDEVFGGYTTFQKTPWLAAGGGALGAAMRSMQPWRGARSAVEAKLACGARVRDRRDAYLLQRALRWDGAANGFERLLPPEAWSELDRGPWRSAYHQVSHLETSFYLRNQLLRDADIMSAAHAIELRVPFLDRAVMAGAWAQPGHAHVGPMGRRKRLLRRVLQRVAPAAVETGPKRGFTLPWDDWLRGPLAASVGDVLADSTRYAKLPLAAADGATLWNAFRAGAPQATWLQVWSLYVLLHWAGSVA